MCDSHVIAATRFGAGMTEKYCQKGRAASPLVLSILTALLVMGSCLPSAAENDPVAAPLTIGEIEILTADIYSAREIENTNGGLRLLRKVMNGVHINTRRYVLRRELLFAAGDAYVPDLLEETERNLRALGFLNDVRVVAVDTTDDGRVNVRVHTQESWTLRTSFSFSLASGGDTRWGVQLSDRNFLGHGVTGGVGVGKDENASFWNLFYRQRRMLGSRLYLGLDYSERQDGFLRQILVSHPFYAQDDPLGMDLLLWDRKSDYRYYLSNAGPAGSDPSRSTSLYAKLPYNEIGLDARFQIRLGKPNGGRIWRLGAGGRVADTVFDLDQPQYELSDGRFEDLGWLDERGQPFARDQGLTVFPYLWVHSIGRQWSKTRFVMQYGPIEDIPLDFSFDLKFGPAGGGLGSTTGYGEARFRAEGLFTKWLEVAGGHVFLYGQGDADTGSRAVRTYRYNLITGWIGRAGAEMSPWMTRIFAEWAQGGNLNGQRALLLGLDRGMRTLEFDGMAGDHLARWNVEQGKAMPWEVAGLVRTGLAVFYSGGRAKWSDEVRDSRDVRHEAGFGLRFGPTRSANSQIARVDLAWDLNGDGSPVLTAITRGYF
jgi:hypothetical protein